MVPDGERNSRDGEPVSGWTGAAGVLGWVAGCGGGGVQGGGAAWGEGESVNGREEKSRVVRPDGRRMGGGWGSLRSGRRTRLCRREAGRRKKGKRRKKRGKGSRRRVRFG